MASRSSVDARQFRYALSRFASGVTVVTARGEDGDQGMTASAFCSVSLDPPLVLVCVAKGGRTHEVLMRADGFVINILAEDQVDVSNAFAGLGPPGSDPWSTVRFTRGAVSRAAVIDGVAAWLDCTIHAVHDGGDHSIFIGEVRDLAVDESDRARPLIHWAGAYRKLDGSR